VAEREVSRSGRLPACKRCAPLAAFDMIRTDQEAHPRHNREAGLRSPGWRREEARMSVRRRFLVPSSAAFRILSAACRPRPWARALHTQFFGGAAWNVPMTLTVHQDGRPDVGSRLMGDGPFVQLSTGRESFARSSAPEPGILLIHDKLYLPNGPTEIGSSRSRTVSTSSRSPSWPLGSGFSSGPVRDRPCPRGDHGRASPGDAGNLGGGTADRAVLLAGRVGNPLSRYFFVSAEDSSRPRMRGSRIARGDAVFWTSRSRVSSFRRFARGPLP